MLTAVFVTARLGSTRLPQKHLIRAAGYSFIEWLLLRLCHEFASDIAKDSVSIFVVTSGEPENKKLEELIGALPDVKVFYGSSCNIPLRHWQCASAHEIDNIVAIDGDDVLCSPAAARRVVERLLNGDKWVKTQGLPFGMNVMGYQASFLFERLAATASLEKETLETGWAHIFEAQPPGIVDMALPTEERLRFTLDYEPDVQFFRRIFEHFGDRSVMVSDIELIDFVTANHLYTLNDSVSEAYWANFNRSRAAESPQR